MSFRLLGLPPQSSRDSLEILPPAVYGSPNRKRSCTRCEAPFVHSGVTSSSTCTPTEPLERLFGGPSECWIETMQPSVILNVYPQITGRHLYFDGAQHALNIPRWRRSRLETVFTRCMVSDVEKACRGRDAYKSLVDDSAPRAASQRLHDVWSPFTLRRSLRVMGPGILQYVGFSQTALIRLNRIDD